METNVLKTQKTTLDTIHIKKNGKKFRNTKWITFPCWTIIVLWFPNFSFWKGKAEYRSFSGGGDIEGVKWYLNVGHKGIIRWLIQLDQDTTERV